MPTPVVSYNSSVEYVADGATSVFPFPFPYQSAADIFVSKNDVDVAFTITGGSNVSLSPTPANGDAIKIYRKTGHSARRVDFTDGATITERDLDTAAVQHFYMGQEGYDLALSLVNEVGSVADAVATCVAKADESLSNALAAGTAYSLAAAARAGAETAYSNSLAALTGANSAMTNANTYAANALASQNAASASAATATTKESQCFSHKVAAEAAQAAAETARDIALGASTSASASAASASADAATAADEALNAAVAATNAFNSTAGLTQIAKVTTQVGNVGAGTDDLMSVTIPANTLQTTRTGLYVFAAGRSAAGATSAKTIEFVVNGVVLASQRVDSTLTQNCNWTVDAYCYRTGVNTQLWVIRFLSNIVTFGGNGTTHFANTTLNEGNSYVLKLTGNSVAAVNNDIIQYVLHMRGNG